MGGGTYSISTVVNVYCLSFKHQQYQCGLNQLPGGGSVNRLCTDNAKKLVIYSGF